MESKPIKSTYDCFLDFRANVIRAVAQAWHDENFKEALLKDPKGTMREYFHYQFPFDMDLKVLPDSAAWDPMLNGGWLTCEQETLELVLPHKPQAGHEAIALAAYNANRLTFLTHY